LNCLNALAGDATVIGLGEITHGITEIFQLKHRIIEFLVKHKGFTIFSIEANMPEAYEINEYVLHGKGDLRELIAGMHFWTWENQDIFNLITFFREYNKTAVNKIQFTGFDGQDIYMPADIVKKFFDNEAMNENIDNIVQCLKDLDHQYYDHCSFQKNELQKIIPVIKKDSRYVMVGEQLTELKSHLAQLQSHAEFSWVQQNLQQLQSKWEGLGTNPIAQRERLMADNILWIQKQNPGQKIMLWGHNGHIHKLHHNIDWHDDMGELLAKALQDKYQAIGFVVHSGSYTAVDQDDSYQLKRDLVLSTPPADSLEEKLRALAVSQSNTDPVLFLNLKHGALPAWLAEPVKARTVTLGCMKEYPLYSFQESRVAKAYDGLIYIENTHGSQPIKWPEMEDEAKESCDVKFFKAGSQTGTATDQSFEVTNKPQAR
jgi:erythromycin esterase